MLNVFVHLFISLFLCLMYPYILLCIYVFILVRKLHPLSHLLALFFSFSPTYTKNKALKTEVYSEKATPINCYPPIATSNVLGPSGLLLSSLLTWLILAILYCNCLRLRVKRKINWNWIELIVKLPLDFPPPGIFWLVKLSQSCLTLCLPTLSLIDVEVILSRKSLAMISYA